MSATEGSGTSNATNYAYTLNSQGTWCGSYECRIHRAFLDDVSKAKVEVSPFKIADTTWTLRVIATEDRKLSLFLVSRTKSVVRVCYMLEIHNHANDNCTIQHNFADTFSQNTSRGKSSVINISSITATKSSFLSGDCFTVKASIRICSEENECYSYNIIGRDAIITWSLRDAYHVFPGMRIYSDRFVLGAREWHLALDPKSRKDGNEYVCFNLVARNGDCLTAMATFSLINHHSFNDSVSKGLNRTFRSMYTSMSLPQFASSAVLALGSAFNKEGWTTIMVQVTIEQQPSQPEGKVHSQSRSETAADTDRTMDDARCVVCLEEPQSGGVVHKNTCHRCYCTGCAKKMAQLRNLRCPICLQKSDVVLERIY